MIRKTWIIDIWAKLIDVKSELTVLSTKASMVTDDDKPTN